MLPNVAVRCRPHPPRLWQEHFTGGLFRAIDAADGFVFFFVFLFRADAHNGSRGWSHGLFPASADDNIDPSPDDDLDGAAAFSVSATGLAGDTSFAASPRRVR